MPTIKQEKIENTGQVSFVKEEAKYFMNFLETDFKDEEFQNMGYFYVVGNEIAEVVLQHDGVESFKKLIVDARENPTVFLQRYDEICSENTELPRINS